MYPLTEKLIETVELKPLNGIKAGKQLCSVSFLGLTTLLKTLILIFF